MILVDRYPIKTSSGSMVHLARRLQKLPYSKRSESFHVRQCGPLELVYGQKLSPVMPTRTVMKVFAYHTARYGDGD